MKVVLVVVVLEVVLSDLVTAFERVAVAIFVVAL